MRIDAEGDLHLAGDVVGALDFDLPRAQPPFYRKGLGGNLAVGAFRRRRKPPSSLHVTAAGAEKVELLHCPEKLTK